MSARAGFIMCAAGIVLMCAMDAVAKTLGASFTTFQVVFLRYLGAALWLAAWIALTGASWPRRADWWPQLQRAVLLVITASFFFFAVARLPLAIVAALGMTAPVYVTLLGGLLFKERLGLSVFAVLALGACGSAIIVLGGGLQQVIGSTGEPLAWLAAILAPLTYAFTVIALKHHSKREEPAAMTLGQSFLAALLVLPLALGDWPAFDARLAGLSGLIGFLGAVGFLLLVHGLKRLPVAAFAVLDYTALIWAAVFGFVFFHEVPGPQLWVGGPLIIAACILNARLSAGAGGSVETEAAVAEMPEGEASTR